MPSASAASITVLDWGRTPYEAAWRRQDDLVAKRIADEIGDTLVFTEHEPVFTIGLRGGAQNNLVWNDAELAREGVQVVKTNRGGDITYHGPGQIVGYPIVSLASHKDLHAYLRFLEQVTINSLGSLGLAAAAAHFTVEWWRHGLPVIGGGSGTPRGWVPPVVLAVLGFFYLSLGLSVSRRARG